MSNDEYQWSPYIESFLKFIVHLIRVLEQFLLASTLGELWTPQKFSVPKVLQCLAASGSFTQRAVPKEGNHHPTENIRFLTPKNGEKNSINLVPGRWPPNNFKIHLRRRFCAAFRFKTTNLKKNKVANWTPDPDLRDLESFIQWNRRSYGVSLPLSQVFSKNCPICLGQVVSGLLGRGQWLIRSKPDMERLPIRPQGLHHRHPGPLRNHSDRGH